MLRKIFAKFAFFFVQGVLVMAPFVLTGYMLWGVFKWARSFLLFSDKPGLTLAIIVGSITAIGALASIFVTRSIFLFAEKLMTKLPLVNIIYTSVRDLIQAFVGDKKKFSEPVLVQLNKENALYRIGFITAEDLSFLAMPDMVAVYLPHSYNVSGNVYFVPRTAVKPLPVSGSAAMKFVVSGGVADLA